MHDADNTTVGLSILAACTSDVRQWHWCTCRMVCSWIWDTDHQNVTLSTSCVFSHIICLSHRHWFSCCQHDENTGCHAWSVSGFQQIRCYSGAIVQLPYAGYLPCTSPGNSWSRVDISLILYRIDLQCNPLQYTHWHRQETTASAEQCSPDRPPNAKTFPCQAATTQPALVAGGAKDHVHAGSDHVQSQSHLNTSLRQSSLTYSQLHSGPYAVIAGRLKWKFLSSLCYSRLRYSMAVKWTVTVLLVYNTVADLQKTLPEALMQNSMNRIW